MDSDDTTLIKLWVHLSDVDSRSGPLTAFSASASARLADAVAYNYSDGYRVSDDRVNAVFGSERQVSFVGRRATIDFTDTCRCFHFGSRVSADGAPRRLLMVEYQTPYAFEFSNYRKEARYRTLAPAASSERSGCCSAPRERHAHRFPTFICGHRPQAFLKLSTSNGGAKRASRSRRVLTNRASWRSATGIGIVAADESIDGVLITRAQGFDDDVVDGSGYARIVDEREKKCLQLHVSVRIRDRDDLVSPKGVEHRGDRLDGSRRNRRGILRA